MLPPLVELSSNFSLLECPREKLIKLNLTKGSIFRGLLNGGFTLQMYYLIMAHLDFEVIKENRPITHRTEGKDSSNADNEFPKGITFKEEEIIENVSSLDPQVFDLLKHANSSSMHPIPSHNKSEAENSVHSSSQAKDSGLFEDMDFHFDQGLIDSYSDLIAEINPVDFLNFEAEFAKQSVTEDRTDLSNSRGVFFAEEVEEEEIVD